MRSSADERLWNYYQVENTACFDNGSRDKLTILSRAIRRRTEPTEFICEVGLGNGQLLLDLSRNRKVMGVDLCAGTVRRLKSLSGFRGIELLQGDITDLTSICMNKGIDVFITIDVIEHLDDYQLDKACKHIYTILPKSGKWFINIPWNENLKNNEIFCPHCEKTFHRVGHKQSFNENTLKAFMENQGFEVKLSKKIFPSNFSLPFPLILMYRLIARIYLQNYSSLFVLLQKK